MTTRDHSSAELGALINDALELLQARTRRSGQMILPDQPLPSLFERCHQIVARSERRGSVPVRTLHHLACTGGTLISRCLAAMPNIRLLSEVDPLNQQTGKAQFAPSDVVRLSRFAARPVTMEKEVDIFLGGLRVVMEDSTASGLTLVLRDHPHSMFHNDLAPKERPTLREMLQGKFPLLSAVTVRHPLDSYLSLCTQGWNRHFSPNTLNEYCLRSHRFLDRHDDLALFRYEDFISAPEEAMQGLCDVLSLTYNPDFPQLFQALKLSGDSGRKGMEIKLHPRRQIPDEIGVQLPKSAAYAALCERLGYLPDA